jgi:hypothetical protein
MYRAARATVNGSTGQVRVRDRVRVS